MGPGGKAVLSLLQLGLSSTVHPRDGAGYSDACGHERVTQWVRHWGTLGDLATKCVRCRQEPAHLWSSVSGPMSHSVWICGSSEQACSV